jgi:hypothetical protein
MFFSCLIGLPPLVHAVAICASYSPDQSTKMYSHIDSWGVTYLVNVDGGLPELLVGLVEVTHTDLTEVTGVELVNVGTVVVLTTGHTATTGRLAVLADTTVTGGHMAAAVRKRQVSDMLVKSCDGRRGRFFRSRSARKDFRLKGHRKGRRLTASGSSRNG